MFDCRHPYRRDSIALAVAGGLLATVVFAADASAAPTYADVRIRYRSSETRFVDRHGEVVQVLRTDPSIRKLQWTPLAEVSPALRTALVYSEDRRFYQHAGIDWQAVGSAAWGNLWNTRTRGASTITMQLAGLLDEDLRATNAGRSITQKIGQGATALALEQGWKKDQILEAYLNLVSYRGEIVGIGALSATLFEKYPSGLNAREAAIAASLVRAPNAPAARVAERACAILGAEAMPDECRGLADYTAMVLAKKNALRLDSDPQLAPHFARTVLRAMASAKSPAKSRAMSSAPLRAQLPDSRERVAETAGGAPIATTLDAGLQRFARATLHTHLAELVSRNVEDGAVIVLDNATGEVLAWVGSSGGLSEASEVDHVLAPRQAGSTLKPFLYELAIEKRWLTAASILDDTPVNLQTAGGLYIPQNYDHAFKGPVSVRTALASSLNVPAVRTLVMVTPERFHQRLRALGFTTLRESGDYYGYALALGAAEVTLAQLTNAYRALANRGMADGIHVVPFPAGGGPGWRPAEGRQPDSRVMDSDASFIVADILADRNARATTFGMSSVLASRVWSAVKTGTSKDMRDNWCIGFTERYTVGVWVGNSNGAAMWDVSGTTGAAPVWQAMMGYLVARDRKASVNASMMDASADRDLPGIVRRAIRFERDLEAPREELFLAGTEIARVSRSTTSGAVVGDETVRTTGAIALPVNGTIVAIDPDIPPKRQRMTFRVAGAVAGSTMRWRLDGRSIGRGNAVEWALWPGRHTLELLDARDATIDRVAFEVRGATVKRGAGRSS